MSGSVKKNSLFGQAEWNEIKSPLPGMQISRVIYFPQYCLSLIFHDSSRTMKLFLGLKFGEVIEG